ncbi:MAG: L-threonylcarbamoyladenylate synthase [Gaiellaceae bacterium]
MTAVADAVAALRAGGLVVMPTDTVYGLACSPYREGPARVLSEVKGRTPEQPIALLAASVDVLLECVPELRGRSGVTARSLLPGPYTLVFPNPARRFPWLTGARPETIGVRVPALDGPGGELLEELGAVAATSANLHGGADPRRLGDVPTELLAAAIALDGGELPGTPSTVVDLTGPEPRVLREGAVAAEDALARVEVVRAQ